MRTSARKYRQKRVDQDWHRKLRRALDRHDYWTAVPYMLNKRKSEGRNPRLETWKERQPFTGRIGWAGQLVVRSPGVNMRISL